MKTLRIDSARHVQLIAPSAGATIPADHLALVVLDDLLITRFYSGDLASGREGTIALKLGGQATTLGWETDQFNSMPTSERERFRDQLLYFGRPRGLLDVELRIIEKDDDTTAAIGKAKSTVSAASAVAGAALPGVGSVVAAGAQLVTAIADFVGAGRDACELTFAGSIGDRGAPDPAIRPLREGKYRIKRRDPDSSNTGDELAVLFSVHALPPPSADPKLDVHVVLDELRVNLADDAWSDSGHLVIELSLGCGDYLMTYSINDSLGDPAKLDHVFGLAGRTVYCGPWSYGVPFSLTAGIVSEADELALIEGVIDRSSALGAELVGTDRDRASLAGTTKAVQSLRALLLEFLPDKKSLASSYGMILERGRVPAGLQGKRSILDVDPASRAWQRFSLRGTGQAGSIEAVMRILIAPYDK